MMKLHDSLPFYVPDYYNERVHDSLVNPAGGSSGIIGSAILRKTLDPTTWIIGANNIATIAGGTVRIESISMRITTTFTSAGAPTLSIGDITTPARYSQAAMALAALTAPNIVQRTASPALAALDPAQEFTTVGQVTPLRLASSVGSPNVIATVATAVYTAGAAELIIIYTPLTAGASIA